TKGWKADRKQDKKRIKRDRVQGQRKSFSLGFGRKLDGAGPVTIEWLYLYWRKCLWHPVTRQLCVSINKLARNAIAVGTTGAGYLGLNVVTFMKIHFDTIGACLKLIDSPVLTFVPVKPLLNFILNFPILRVPLKALKKIATVALSYTDLGLVNLASKVNGATNALV
ncbi:MAG: hypothetical protein LBH47_03840, partial [Christensenellaceae bacterium]|nr:hypothetical protein [Christensenellaceae bacterium]